MLIYAITAVAGPTFTGGGPNEVLDLPAEVAASMLAAKPAYGRRPTPQEVAKFKKKQNPEAYKDD